MGDEPPGALTHAEITELDALRRRAYGADADIFDHPGDLARLNELEERMRRERFPPEPPEPPSVAAALDAAAEDQPHRPASPEGASDGARDRPPPPAARGRRVPHWHGALVATTAAVALLLGGAGWSAARLSTAEALAAEDARIAAAVNEQREASYRASYRLYIDGLRDGVLTLPGAAEVAQRMVRDRLRPLGLLYGRTVGVGPTSDDRFCMIIADLPEASVTCIPVENAYANPVSVLLPSWYSDADSDLFTGLGELVSYTLMPGGSVIAEPADTAEFVGVPDASAPTAVPPPGWQ